MDIGVTVKFGFKVGDFVKLPFDDQFGFVIGCYWTGDRNYLVQVEEGRREYYQEELLSRVEDNYGPKR